MVALKTWFFCAIGYKILDVITTLYLVTTHGREIESNPFAHDMMYAYGVIPGLIINGVIVCMLLGVLYKYKKIGLLVIATFLLMIPILLNTITILIS